jgi:hypothetical protein
MPTTIEVKVNGAIWISIDLQVPLGRQAVEEIDKVFKKIVTDKNRDKIGGFVIDPGVIKKFRS